MKFPIDIVKNWFLENQRFFPWRENHSPYRVWVSEVMLQQTIAAVVVPYFEKWMERFPDIQSLAKAEESDVIKLWEGLGYYARARNLHKGAKYVMDHFGGKLPDSDPLLEKIPGLGPYTRGAILSFAFHKKAPAIDANVTRLICRYYAIDEEIEKQSCQKKFRDKVEEILPEHEPWVLSEAFIELGATVCKKKAECSLCPLKTSCASKKHDLQNILPKKRLKPKATPLFRIVAIIEYRGEYLLKMGEKGKVMSGLYEFPYIEKMAPPTIDEAISALEKVFGSLNFKKKMEDEKHTFTRFRAHLFPFILEAGEKFQGIWKKKEELHDLPFSSGHKRILQKL